MSKLTKKQRKLWKRWSWARKGLASLQFRYARLAPGVELLTAWTDRVGWPAGFLIYQQVARGLICTLHSYVPPWARRAGVRTAMHHEILRGYPKTVAVITGEASGKASRKWLKKMGFKKSREGWRLEIERDA